MNKIIIRSASENNLKGIDVHIPHGKLTVVTGISGSGKSSLVRDILFREGQRMYFETFSSYTRSRLGKIRPAKVSEIQGLLPVISIGQTHILSNRRSTAGTFSEISSLLRQLFSRYNDQKLPLSRSHFSFNSEKGWCPQCKGLGINEFIDVSKIVADPKKTLRQGALCITLPNGYTIYSQVTIDEMNKVCSAFDFDVDTPWENLTQEQQNIVLNGTDKVNILYGKHSLESRMKWTGLTARPRDEGFYKGIIPVMEDILKRDRNDNILRFVSSRTCTLCSGSRLNPKTESVTWKKLNFSQYETLSFQELLHIIQKGKGYSKGEEKLLSEITSQLEVLCQLSTGHISCSRLTETLSQGELRRIRLSQLHHNGLTGVLYLFDEPSIGLHIRDVKTLLEIMFKLTQKGNTVVIVEHNEQIIRAADYLIELGPGAGQYGGEIVYQGTPEDLKKSTVHSSLTAGILKQSQLQIPNNQSTKQFQTFNVFIEKSHNIVEQNFTFAFHAMNVITGVSGAGKSTLVEHGLAMTTAFQDIIHLNQKPIGRTSRSNPATYTGLADELRKLFASSAGAKKAHLTPGHFSFNNKIGQCEICNGAGVLKTGMFIFEDMVQTCPHCHGKRFKEEVLSAKYHDKSISEVLELSVEQALGFFKDTPTVLPYLKAMEALGLGYLTLGQSSSTLSGGEAQRIKLAQRLHREKSGNNLYILDEPTSGLHHEDIKKLISALRNFIAKGHTIVIVEHDYQVISSADWIVDVGPEGGAEGGKCLFSGTATDFFTRHQSPTTRALIIDEQLTNKHEISEPPAIDLRDISTNILKHIDLHIPAGQLTAFTGLSGSGKTSLLMHTIHAEGQRLFTSSLSGYQRLRIGQISGGQVGQVNSIMPTVAVESDIPKPHLRSTTGSLAGIYSMIRLLYARFSDNRNESLTSSDFSYSNEYSVCPKCEGVGFIKQCDPELLVIRPELALEEGALNSHKTIQYFLSENNKHIWTLRAMAQNHGIQLHEPWNSLQANDKDKILYGTGETKYSVVWQYKRKNNTGEHHFEEKWAGLCALTEEEYHIHFPSARGKHAMDMLQDVPCTDCKGYRLNEEMLKYTFCDKHIGQMMELTIAEMLKELQRSEFLSVSEALVRQLKEILDFLNNAGLGHLPLNRPAAWLSSGELKWIRLSNVLASELSGMCLILDEPFYGMDHKARLHLVQTLINAKNRGNTILISDHHPELIQIADRLIELGPGSGSKGGNIIADIKPDEITSENAPIAAMILSNEKIIRKKAANLNEQTAPLELSENISIFAEKINLITGHTGSGKTKTLHRIHSLLTGSNYLNTIMIGNSFAQHSKGTSIASKCGYLADLQTVFAKTSGLPEKDFNYHHAHSQCQVCKGIGTITTTLDFLPDVIEICHDCDGKRYKDEILEYQYHGKSISDWFDFTIDEVFEFQFLSKKTLRIIQFLKDLGLGYLNCSQDIQSLSSGEKQRLAIAEELTTMKQKESLILFDSPFKGLDPLSIQQMIQVFEVLLEKGHTLIIAESEEFSPLADHIIYP